MTAEASARTTRSRKWPKHGKRYRGGLKLVDRTKDYAPAEAVAVLKSMPRAKFDETVEVHLRLNVDPRHADQQVRSTVMLPAGTGKTVRIMAFVEGEAARLAQEAGADYVGTDEFVSASRRAGSISMWPWPCRR